MVLANIGLRERWARIATLVAAAVVAIAALLLGVFAILLAQVDPRAGSAAGAQGAPALVICGALGLLCFWPAARIAIARAVPIDPESPVHLLALVLTLALFGLQVQTALSGALAQEAGSGAALSRLDLVLGEVPFLLGALLGVGLFVRRGTGASLTRLGFTVPAWWQVVLGVAAAGVFFAVAVGLDQIGYRLTPKTAQEVNSATNRIFGQLTSDPGGVITIAVAAGICEEALFRGALQPRLGILWTSLLFASVHSQYGISFDALAVLVLAIGLGLIRRFLSTTVSAICHISYDLLTGFGLSQALLAWAGGTELALLLVLLGVLIAARARRRTTAPTP